MSIEELEERVRVLETTLTHCQRRNDELVNARREAEAQLRAYIEAESVLPDVDISREALAARLRFRAAALKVGIFISTETYHQTIKALVERLEAATEDRDRLRLANVGLHAQVSRLSDGK
jgi:hypothetical protein